MQILTVASILFLILISMSMVILFTIGAGKSKTPYEKLFEDQEQMQYIKKYHNTNYK